MSEDRISVAYAITTFCDDIRNELDGVVSIIGARANLVLPDFPLIVPKLAFHVQIIAPPLPKGEHELTASIYMPGDAHDQPTFQIPGKMHVIEDSNTSIKDPDIPKHSKIVQQFVVSPLQIKQEGLIKVRVQLGSLPIIKAGVMRVQRLPDPAPKIEFKFGALKAPGIPLS